MNTLSQYEMNELALANREIDTINKSSLADRKQGKQEMFEMINTNLDLFFQHLAFLVSGDYSHGVLIQLKRASKRTNRRAMVFNMTAVFEYKTSVTYACQVWNSLDTDLQLAINREIDELLTDRIDNTME